MKLRLSQGSKILGEWTLEGEPLEFSLCDDAGTAIASFTAALPTLSDIEESTLVRPLGSEEIRALHAAGIRSERTDTLSSDDSDELPTSVSRNPLDVTQELTLDAAGDMTHEMPAATAIYAPGERAAEPSVGSLARIPGDDFTMPYPEATDPSWRLESSGTDPLLRPLRARSARNLRASFHSSRLPESSPSVSTSKASRGVHQGRRSEQRGSKPDALEEPTPVSSEPLNESVQEVWFYKDGGWLPRGWLAPGQRASLRGGVVRCLQDGSLLVSPGLNFTIAAALPGGEQFQAEPGHKPIRFPSETSVTLWDGQRGLHVRMAELGT